MSQRYFCGCVSLSFSHQPNGLNLPKMFTTSNLGRFPAIPLPLHSCCHRPRRTRAAEKKIKEWSRERQRIRTRAHTHIQRTRVHLHPYTRLIDTCASSASCVTFGSLPWVMVDDHVMEKTQLYLICTTGNGLGHMQTREMYYVQTLTQVRAHLIARRRGCSGRNTFAFLPLPFQ